MRPAAELNLDGLPGPTYNHAGLAFGNLASMANRLQVSNPKAAAIQGLEKMRLLMEMGLPQGVLPPQERPDLGLLRRAGFGGSESAMLQRARRCEPELLAASYSAAAMWVANAATISPSADTADARVHLTPANLSSHLHRSIESEATERLLRSVFADEEHFAVHAPLPGSSLLRDEGAANHVRLCSEHGSAGLELFVYGEEGHSAGAVDRRFPARQSLEGSRAVARLHRLNSDHTLFVRQNPDAIDRGVFHNDLISMGNGPVLLVHETAFADQESTLRAIESGYARLTGETLCVLEASEAQVSVAAALDTFLFNSQLVTLTDKGMCLVAPKECREEETVFNWIEQLLAADNPIEKAIFVDLRESMRNGGGPACLRLRG